MLPSLMRWGYFIRRRKLNMRDICFANNEIYHVFNRGAAKNDIFKDDFDRIRLLKGLLIFNNIQLPPSGKEARELWKNPIKSNNRLVDIYCYALMDNHFHLLLEQRIENGITKFMQRLGNGYTKYFNARHDLAGVLLSGPFRAVHVKTTEQLLHVSRYIHLNPLDHGFSKWRAGTCSSRQAQDMLRSYEWSSYRHFAGLEHNVIVDPQKIFEHFECASDYESYTVSWAARDMDVLENLIIE